MDTVFKALFFRQPPIHYVSPPVCENLFSSSSGPVIILNAFPRLTGITGLVMGGAGDFFIRWGSYPGAICYSVYMSTDPNDPAGTYVLVAECIPNPEFDVSSYPDGTVFVVTAITADGETPFSELVTVNKVAGCPIEVGDPAPEDFNISGEVIWPAIHVDYTDGAMTYDSSGFPYDTWYYTEFPDDYPPGNYDLEYISGAVAISWSGPGTDYSALAYKVAIVHSGIAFTYADMGNKSVALNFMGNFYIQGPPIPTESGAVSALEVSYSGSRFGHYFPVSNDDEPMRICVDKLAWDNAHAPGASPYWTTSYPMMMRLIQVDGLIQQPRSLEIVGWNTAKVSFPSEVKDNWNGVFDNRTTYTANSCVWDAAANPLYSAQISYMATGNPRHVSGRGWKLEIFSMGVTLVWRGYKGVGDTGDGEYYAEAGLPVTALPCVLVEEI